MSRIIKLFVFVVALLMLVSPVSAHFFGGYTIQNISGDYIYSVNFSSSRPYSGTPLVMDLHLYKDNNVIRFSNVQIIIKQFNIVYLDKVTPFVEGDNTSTEITFQNPGRYQVYLTYFQENNVIASSDFELTVFESPNPVASNLILWSPLFLLILILGFWARSNYKNKKNL